MSEKKVFGTKEWASSSINILNGCQHDCIYCYAKASCHRHGGKIENWDTPTIRENTIKKNIGKRKGTIMFPTTHDIHPDNLDLTLTMLEDMLLPGNAILIVSKPHLKCISAICNQCKDYKDKILFRFTIGSADDETLKFWEPNAPSFDERLSSLKHAFEQGFKTSVSCEPMLDNRINAVIEKVQGYVNDAIWIGRANFLASRLKANGAWNKEIQKRAEQLEAWQSDINIWTLYYEYKDSPLIKWKESIKKIVGLDIPTEAGLDI